MEERTSDIETLSLVGGRLCLDFANTVGSHTSDHPDERLHSYRDLVAWSRRATITSDEQVAALLAEAERRPEAAESVLVQAHALREAIYRIFSAVAAGIDPRPEDLELLNEFLSHAMAQARIVHTGNAWAWDWAPGPALDRMLWPVVRSAADLLSSGEIGRVRECSGPTCGWLFVDLSRNKSRRWCDMNDCGNRAKARRHYHRARGMAEHQE